MSKFTDILIERQGKMTKAQFAESLGASRQKFNGWENGRIPEDDQITKIAEITGLDFLLLVSAARGWGSSGNAQTRTEWRKIHNHRKKELSIKKEEKMMRGNVNINRSLI